MAKINSRSKGKRGELQWRDKLREHGFHAERGQQRAGSPDSPDVICRDMPGWHAEVKHTECFNAYAAMEQAERDAGDDRVPYVAHRRSRRDWLVVLYADDFLKLIKDAM